MLQKLFAYAILLATVLWLMLSYVPASVVTLPQIAFASADSGRLFQMLLVGGFGVFVVLQIWIVYATTQFVGTENSRKESRAAEFGLNRSSEMLWTAVPLLMTIGLALASYQTWSMLTPVK